MSFKLRGGRPKNMTQGVYWVRRHLRNRKTSSLVSQVVIPDRIIGEIKESRKIEPSWWARLFGAK